MAETNTGLDIPPNKKIRLDSTASEGSDALHQLLNDLDGLPDLPLDGPNDSGLLNSTINATNPIPQQQQQNALTPIPNHQGPNVSPSITPPVSSQGSSGATPFNNSTPPQSQPPSVNNTTPNATINMYSNSPRGDSNSLYSNFNAMGNAPSPQPMAVSTLADPTPTLPAVSSTPAHVHGPAVMAPSSSMQGFDSMTRPTPSSTLMMSSQAPSMMQQQHHGVRGEAQMHPGGIRMGMNPGYQSGQGMHPGMHGMHGGMTGSIRMQQGGMMGPMRVGVPQVHPGMPMQGQIGRPGMVTHTQGIHHGPIRTQYPHGYPHHMGQQHIGPRMINHHMGMHGNSAMNPALRRPGMPMGHAMAPGGQQPIRLTNPSMMGNRPPGGGGMYNMPQGQNQMHSNSPFSGSPNQMAQMQQQQSMSNNTLGPSPAPPIASQGVPGAPSPMPVHQVAQNDLVLGGQQTNQGGSQQSGGPIGGTVSQASQQQPTPNTALGSTGGTPSLPGRTNIQPGLNASIEENPLPQGQPSQQPPQPQPQQPAPQQQPPSANSQPQSSMNPPMNSRVPTPPPPGTASGNMFAGPKLPQTPGAPPGQTSDPEKRKQIQQQLVLLLHAHKCQRRQTEQQASGDYRPCSLPHCKTMKSVLNHMTECQAGRSCTYAHCATSRQIINHWRNCTRPDCPVCLPLKHPQQPQKSIGQPADLGVGVSPQMPVQGVSGAGPGMIPNTDLFGSNAGMGMGQSSSGMGGPSGPMMRPAPNMAHGHVMPGTGGMMDPGRQMYSAAPGGAGRDIMGGFPNPGAPGMGSQSSYPLPIPQIVSNPTQPWHSQVNPDLRQHLVRKLVEAIYPVHDPTALRDTRVKSLIQYAMKVERVMFEAAQNRDAYYKLLAQKIYLIRKELEDRKRNKRPPGVALNMVNGGDPSHQFPGGHSSSGQYPLPPTPKSINTPSATGNPSPHPTNDLSGFPRTPIQSIDPKKEPGSTIMSPTGLPTTTSTDSSSQSLTSLPGSIKTEVKNELLSPILQPGSNTAPPLSQQQAIKTELSSIPSMPPLPDIPSVPNVPTPSAPGVPSVKPPDSIKRKDSISEMPLSAKPATPSVAMDSNTPRSPATNKIKPDPSLKKVFTTDELESALRPVFNAVWNQDVESFPFRNPVDPILLGIPDYFEVIKQPMDLTTISNKLSKGDYKNGWEFCSDMWLMFDNAWLYNKKTSRVYKYCSKLSEVFDLHISQAMQQLGYCCGMRYTYHPQVLYCYGKPLCTIPRDSPYYGCQNRYIYCPKCFNEIQGDTVTVGDDPLSATRIPKSQFKELKNNAIDREPFVDCIHCGRKMHQICVLHHDHIWPGGFQCDSCLKALGKTKKDNKYRPKRLPVTKLGSYLEDRINSLLVTENSGAGHVTIRVVSSSDKTLDTRPLMRERFSGDFPSQFPYRTKALFVFEEIDNVDVCFFGMHVQEYGSDCQAPNTRRVYISYLDSVHFFSPRHYRTKVYHEILIGYLDFCKANGFMTAHIWACPPSEGDDYIFHCHPLEQKIPKPKRLSDWYRKMLDTAKDMNVIHDYKDIFKHCTDEGVAMVTELPYFEGDFWPNVVEEFIKELDQEAKEREASELSSEGGPKKVGKRGSNKKGSKKAGSTRNKATKKGGVSLGGDDLSSKVYQTMEKHKDVFFTVLLQPPSADSSPLPGTTDPDQLITCDLMDGRDAFLTMSREKHWEFSSLRRAKFSSISMVYELHTQGDKFMYNCNSCHLDVVARYHCTECDDFDLCIKCYKEVGHNHKMVRLGLDIDDPQSNDSRQLDPQKARQASVQKCIQALVHATQCRDPHCKQPSCIKMKRVLTHTRECKLMQAGKWNQCMICKQFVLLCISHAKICTDDACRVPLCGKFKNNLKEQRKQRTAANNRFAQQRVARMAMLGGSNGTNASSPQQSTSSHVSPQGSTGKNPNPAVPSPAPPRSVGGKGGPKTPGTPGGKGRMMGNPTTPAGTMGDNAGRLMQVGKPEANMSIPPNVTVTQPQLMEERQIMRVGPVSTEQIFTMLQDPARKPEAVQIMNSNPELKARVHQHYMHVNARNSHMHHPNYVNPSARNPMYNQHPRPAMYGSGYGHPQQQQMMSYPANHPQYPMTQVNAARMAPGNYPPRTPYQSTAQQNHPTLQRMLTSGTPQQYATHQPSYNPQMNAHLGPPPQYGSTMNQHPMPQTAGYPQVLGQPTRPVPAPSPIGSHMVSQMQGAQYGATNQGMGMDHMDTFMYQPGQPHQFSLNSSNNNNYSHGERLAALPPQDRLSKFVENL